MKYKNMSDINELAGKKKANFSTFSPEDVTMTGDFWSEKQKKQAFADGVDDKNFSEYISLEADDDGVELIDFWYDGANALKSDDPSKIQTALDFLNTNMDSIVNIGTGAKKLYDAYKAKTGTAPAPTTSTSKIGLGDVSGSGKSKVWLYVGIGTAALVLIGVIVYFATRKK